MVPNQHLDEGFRTAVMNGDLGLVKFFLSSGADPNIKSRDHGSSLLHLASTPEIVKELLKCNADINAEDFYKRTPLCCAVTNRNSLEVVKVLLSEGANVNTTMLGGTTPLHVASSVQIVEELLRNGADINAVDLFGRAPLHSALIDKKGFDVIRSLLKAGTDLNMRIGIFRNTFLHYADSLDVVREFISCGLQTNAVKTDGQTPLHCAVKHMKECAVVRELIKHGAQVNKEDRNGESPLSLALKSLKRNRNFEVIKELLRNGADINCRMFDDSLFLHCTIIESAACDSVAAEMLIRIFLLKNYNPDYATNIDLNIDIHPQNCRILMDFKDNCLQEIIQMSSEMFNSKMKMLEIAKSNNLELKSTKIALRSYRKYQAELASRYPIYANEILENFEKLMDKGRLLNRLGQFDISTKSSIKLNSDCVLILADYLEEVDMLNLLIAFE